MSDNPYEEQARLEKAVAMLGVLRKACKGGSIDSETLEALDTSDWNRMAQAAGKKPPGAETIALVKRLVLESQS